MQASIHTVLTHEKISQIKAHVKQRITKKQENF